MHALHEWQEALMKTIVDGAPSAFDATRVAIYRHNTRTNLIEALRDVYPVVERLVGKEFFSQCARRFCREQWMRSGNIHDFGGEFPAFLEGYPPAATLAYLADTGRLEWHVHRAFHAPERPTLAPETLAAVPPQRIHDVVLRLQPACRLLTSPFPVHLIWQANQGANDGAVDLARGGVELLVHRPNHTVELRPLTASEMAFLDACRKRHSFMRAVEAAMAVDAQFPLESFLAHAVTTRAITGFYLRTPRGDQ